MTARELFQLNVTNPHTMTFGDEYDIYNMCKFGWYEWCHYFYDSKVSMFQPQKECLGIVLGPDKNEGNETTQWIIKDNGNIIPRRTVKKLAYNNLPPRNEVEKGNRDAFYNKINIYLVNLLTLLQQHRTPNNYQKMTMK